MAWQAEIRQWKYPKEFRIQAPVWPEETATLLERIATALAQQPAAPAGESWSDSASRKQFLADVGTGAWRLRAKMVQPETDTPLEEMRRAYRHFESVWDALKEEGVSIYDHTGEDFDAGKSLQVLAYQPTAGLRRERVLETIKPTIYVDDELVQMGEVIVGTPPESGAAAKEGSS